MIQCCRSSEHKFDGAAISCIGGCSVEDSEPCRCATGIDSSSGTRSTVHACQRTSARTGGCSVRSSTQTITMRVFVFGHNGNLGGGFREHGHTEGVAMQDQLFKEIYWQLNSRLQVDEAFWDAHPSNRRNRGFTRPLVRERRAERSRVRPE